jgi:hypothetical protein
MGSLRASQTSTVLSAPRAMNAIQPTEAALQTGRKMTKRSQLLARRPDDHGDDDKRVKIAREQSRRYAGIRSRLMKGRSLRSTQTVTLKASRPSRHRTAILTGDLTCSFVRLSNLPTTRLTG